MNLLPSDKIAALGKCFTEGRGIRETERLTHVHRDTVSRYFRLFSDPAPNATPPEQGSVIFEVVEHADNWHVFAWNDETPEWWRHIATFHSELRAREYATECQNWDFARDYPDSPDIQDVIPPYPRADEGPAPLDRLPPPPVEEPTARERRQAEAEDRRDEEAAKLERTCEICGTKLVRKPLEPVFNFGKRKTCSDEHAQQLMERRRVERKAAISGPVDDARAAELAAIDNFIAERGVTKVEPTPMPDGSGGPLSQTPIPMPAWRG